MRRKRQEGYVQLTTADTAWHLPLEEFEKVRAAWLKGARFVDTVSFYGARITVRLDDVDSINAITADAIAAELEDSRANAGDDTLTGGVV